MSYLLSKWKFFLSHLCKDFDEIISGYDCEINLDDASKCAPKSVLLDYVFTFQEGQPATAIVSSDTSS